MGTLEKAIELAARAHAGQRDKAGAPYILHPLRMMMGMETDEERQAAVLHDVLEDSPTTAGDLLREGFSEGVVTAVTALSRKREETYSAFIERIKGNALARKVKLADLEDNMDVRRLRRADGLTEKDLIRLKKYFRAWKVLREMEDG